MALPADFNKIFGSTFTGGLTPIADVDYSKGWEFVGSNPPTKNDFSYLQNFSDLKAQWLYKNKSSATAVTAQSGRLSISALVGGVERIIMIQWGVVNAPRQAKTSVTLPVTYDNECLFTLATKGSAISLTDEYSCGCSPVNTSTIELTNSNAGTGSTQGIRWLTIGY